MLYHPDFNSEYSKYRLVYEGGKNFVETYLQKLSARETEADFKIRKAIAYNPCFAATALDEVMNGFIQRLNEIKRIGGTKSYKSAILHDIDNEYSSMNYFIANKILPELLPIGKVGVLLDKTPEIGQTLAEQVGHPYLYVYPAQSIMNWKYIYINGKRTLVNLLLEEYEEAEDDLGFSQKLDITYKHFRLTPEGVEVNIYGVDKKLISTSLLNLSKIPFYCLELKKSLLKDVSDYQIALLNIASSDLNYILKANYPFYVEPFDPKLEMMRVGQGEQTIDTGVTTGRRYPSGTEAPSFIHPSSEPLLASMKKQEQMKEEIRTILHLTVSSLASSPETKALDARALEAGLSTIGIELQNFEEWVADVWGEYEGSSERPTISYPEKYDLKTDQDKRDDAKQLEERKTAVPSPTYQKEIGKKIATILLKGDVTNETLKKIHDEIDSAKVLSSDPDVIVKDVEIGLVSLETASIARGYPAGETEKAKEDHAERLGRIAAAQATSNGNDPNKAARGVSEQDPNNPVTGGSKEKQNA